MAELLKSHCVVVMDSWACCACIAAGVSVTASGINVYKVLKTHLAVRVYEGLSVDSAWGVINADRSTNPVVHQHIPPDMPRVRGTGATSVFGGGVVTVD